MGLERGWESWSLCLVLMSCVGTGSLRGPWFSGPWGSWIVPSQNIPAFLQGAASLRH